MVRRKRQVYIQNFSSRRPNQQKVHPAKDTQTHSQGNTLFSAATVPPVLSARTAKKRLCGVKKTLIVVVCMNAACSWIATVLGYVVVKESNETEVEKGVKSGLVIISLVQVWLVASYWNAWSKYTECIRRGLISPSVYTERPLYPFSTLLICFLECCLHLISPLPAVSSTYHYRLYGKSSSLSLDSILYVFILLRNYHTLRLIFCLSRYSNFRTQFHIDIANIQKYNSFLLRCYLSTYTLKFVLAILMVLILLSGVVKYSLESHNWESEEMNEWDDFWIIAYSQLTIGYGDKTPKMALIQLLIILSSALGTLILGLFNAISGRTLVLNLTECNLYSELLYTRRKRHYSKEAVVMLQRWWRLILMRLRKTLEKDTILSFYSYKLTYRETLVDCQHLRDTRFERQIDAFEKSILHEVQPLNAYLRPVSDAAMMVWCR